MHYKQTDISVLAVLCIAMLVQCDMNTTTAALQLHSVVLISSYALTAIVVSSHRACDCLCIAEHNVY
jgi:hypothetical protein